MRTVEFVSQAVQFAGCVIGYLEFPQFVNGHTRGAQFINDFVHLPKLLTAMRSLMLPDVNCSHLGATPEIKQNMDKRNI